MAGATPKATRSHRESNYIPMLMLQCIPNRLVVLVKRATAPSRKSQIAEIHIHQQAIANLSWL